MKKLLVLLLALALFVAVFTCTGQAAFADDKLGKFKEKVDEKKPAQAKPSKLKKGSPTPSFEEEGDEEEEDEWNIAVGWIFAEMFGAILTDMATDNGVRYRAFPYSKEDYLFYAPKKDARVPGVAKTEYQRINSDLYGLTWRLTLRMPTGWDVSAVSTHYDERLRSGNHVHMDYVRFRLSRIFCPGPDLADRRDEDDPEKLIKARFPSNLILRFNFGGAVIDGRGGLDLGMEADWFFYKPFTFHAGVGHSFIRNGISDIDVGLGVMVGPFEFSAGYRGLVTKGDQIDGAYISLGFWF